MATRGPELPLDNVREKLVAMDSVPLFMRSLPSGDKTGAEDSIALEALQALIHEGTPDEIASNFKEQGNEYFKERRYREAKGFYTQGIDAQPESQNILEALLCNRAACNLELENYGSVLRDCAAALSANTKCIKAYYRSSIALLALERAKEALDCCDRCLAIDPENISIKGVRERARNLKEKQNQKAAVEEERKKQEGRKRKTLSAALKSRNLIVLPPADRNAPPPDLQPSLSENGALAVPMQFLYPQYAQSDVISAYHEHDPFTEHLRIMFPPEGARANWDVTGEYTTDNLSVYFQTRRKQLLKVGKRMTLADVFVRAAGQAGAEMDGLELKEGSLHCVVLPKGKIEDDWVEEVKRSRDG